MNRIRFAPLIVAFALFCSAEVLTAQSITLPFSQSGPVLRTESSLATATDEALGLGIGAGYTLAGVLDLGLYFGAEVAESESSITSDIGMYYGYAPLKQSNGALLSVQIYGRYTFREESSDFLTRNSLVREARGHRLAIAFVRDLFVSRVFGFRIGGLAEYSNYTETTSVGSVAAGLGGTAEVDYADYPWVEQLSGFVYGAYVGVVIRTTRGSAFLAGTSLLTDPDSLFRVRPDVQMLVGRGAR